MGLPCRAPISNWPPRARPVGDGHRDLAAEPIRLVRLAFADAFHPRGVQRVDLRSDLAPLLITHAARQGKRKNAPRATGQETNSLRFIVYPLKASEGS